MQIEQAYDEILEVLNRHKDVCVYDIESMKRAAKNHLFGLELKEKYGFDIDPKKVEIEGRNYFTFDEYRFIGWFGEKYGRTVSWPDDESQPDDEFLLNISFSTGAYIFGKDYPGGVFQQFFNELKSYGPKYIDSHNCSLYFPMENAGKVFSNFKSILDKYWEKNKEDVRKRRAEKLRAELKKLEENPETL